MITLMPEKKNNLPSGSIETWKLMGIPTNQMPRSKVAKDKRRTSRSTNKINFRKEV